MTSESPSTTDSGAPQAPASTAAPGSSSPASTDGLRRLLKILVIITAVVAVVFGVFYYLSQRQDSGPNLADREVVKAEQLVIESPNDVAARLGLAGAYLQANREDDALAQYEEIIKADDTNRAAHIGAGTIRFGREDFEGAKADFEAVVKNSGKGEFANADPQLESSQFYLGQINLRLGDVPGAIAALQAALAIDDTDADAWNALGGAQVQAANYKEAVNAYDQALAYIPAGWCEPYEGLSVAYGKLNDANGVAFANGMAAVCNGDPETGISQLKGLTSGPFAARALLGLGMAAEANSDPTTAIGYYEQVIKADPKNIAALTALARLGTNDPHANASLSPSASGS